MTVQRISSGGPYEDVIGYSRAVIAGPNAYVSGCTAVVDGAVHHDGDPYQQAITAFGVALDAIAQAGFGPEHVVRTRMYVTHTRDMDEVGRAHKELFDAVRPAATMVVVAKLIDPLMLVEVEVDAYREDAG
ncbi:RidA family protein [Actinospica robiniae]|uniref:RidA family protein n=1 Tax=Actinospica robiniae TaxID=304901 RepID=UPI0004116AEA|nr:RidA family protein [Actinospica robiniae]